MLISGCGNKPAPSAAIAKLRRDDAIVIVARARPGKAIAVCKAQVSLRRV
jgi:hypothetical protein